MTTQQAPAPELSIRNQHLAVFTAIHLNQEPEVRVTHGRAVFVFQTAVTFDQLDILYKSSVLHQALELNYSLGRRKRNLLTQTEEKTHGY